MDQREINLAWWIAGILLVLLIIVTYLWLNQKQSLPTVLQNGDTAISAERNQITKDCSPGPDADKTACAQDLSDLSGILQQFSVDIQNAATSTASSSVL